MHSSEAKKVLLLYRGQIDERDPQFAEALAQAKRDPDLVEWLRRQTESYRAIQTNFREIAPPVDLRDEIVRRCPAPLPRPYILSDLLKLAAAILILAGAAAFLFHRSKAPTAVGQSEKEITVRGEILDMACYIAYNYSGPDHAACARDCIRKGLPVGIKDADGKTYLLIGATKPVNNELADYAAKTVTIRGKMSIRDGFAQLEVEDIRL